MLLHCKNISFERRFFVVLSCSRCCVSHSVAVVMTDQFRTAFNNAIIAEEKEKGASSSYLSDNKHLYILSRLDSLSNGSVKKEGKDYRLLKQYAKQEALIQGILVTQLCHPKTGLLYLPHSQLFDAIREQHLITGHGGRDIMHQKTRLKYPGSLT